MSRPHTQSPVSANPRDSAFGDDEFKGKRQLDLALSNKNAPPCKKICKPCRRIPCKARGLTSAHNDETAFFEVPLDVLHGQQLRCSHPECSRSTRRFRYCTKCTLPVAKRNFLKRHGHGLVRTTKQLKEEVDHRCGYVTSFNDRIVEVPEGSDECQRPGHRRSVSSDSSNKHCDKLNALRLSDAEEKWLDLLHQRPDIEDHVKMNAWMDKVISYAVLYVKRPKTTNTNSSINSVVAQQPIQHPSSRLLQVVTPTENERVQPSTAVNQPSRQRTDQNEQATAPLQPRTTQEVADFVAQLDGCDFATFFDD